MHRFDTKRLLPLALVVHTPPDESPHWSSLVSHQKQLADADLRALFVQDPARARDLTFEVGDLTVDFSKHLITGETLALLGRLATDAGFAKRRQAMFAGEPINITENRSVLHIALRSKQPVLIDGRDVVPDVRSVLKKMAKAADQIRAGAWLGATGRPIAAVINIGIGGSDLGPLMATRALRHLKPAGLAVRFVSNIDAAHLDVALEDLDAETTLFVVASKTFTTTETMTNARSARRWVRDQLGENADIARHFVAVSTNAGGVAEFGIDTTNMFEFWDWVGGRYSVDAAIGFSLMCAIGSKGFDEFLDGFRIIDEHFHTSPLAENVPALSALLGLWYRNFWGWQTHAVLPYSQALDRFPAYLQQLDMESNGKRISLDGAPVGFDTAPIVWGEARHQRSACLLPTHPPGHDPVPCDFIGFLEPEPSAMAPSAADEHHRLLFANLVAQSEALAFGRTADEVAAGGVRPRPGTPSHVPGQSTIDGHHWALAHAERARTIDCVL